jgi:hypothetical protein
VPALIDPVKLPLEFRRRQTIDLVDWDGDPAHEGFRALCDAITKLTNRKVRVTSDYDRLGAVEVDLSRVGSTIQNAGGDSLFLVKIGENPLELEYNPDGTVAYHGQKQ